MSYITRVEDWLEQNEIADSSNPLVVSLRSAALELEALDGGELELTDAQVVSARKGTRYSLNDTTRRLQQQIDRNDSLSRIKRHQVVHGEIAAKWLGLLDLGLLRAETRTLVAAEVQADHGIDLSEFEPVTMEG